MAKARLTKEQRLKRRKRFRRKLTGFIFLVFALIGVAAIVVLVVNRVNVALDDTSEKQEYEKLFTALVAIDPTDFSSIEKADPEMLKLASIMTTLDLETPEKYEHDENGYIILPTADIDRYTTLLFGPKIHLENKTFGQTGILSPIDGIDHTGYLYMPEKEAYLIPPTSNAGSYIPKVESITRSGNTKILTIAYMQLPSTPASIIDPNTLEVAKYREFVLLKEGKEFYLYSIRIPQTVTE